MSKKEEPMYLYEAVVNEDGDSLHLIQFVSPAGFDGEKVTHEAYEYEGTYVYTERERAYRNVQHFTYSEVGLQIYDSGTLPDFVLNQLLLLPLHKELKNAKQKRSKKSGKKKSGRS